MVRVGKGMLMKNIKCNFHEIASGVGLGRRRARSGRGRVSVCVGLTVSNCTPPKDSKTQKSCNPVKSTYTKGLRRRSES